MKPRIAEDLAAAWGALKRDPVRVLLPAAGLLLLETGLLLALRDSWTRLTPDPWTWVALGASVPGLRFAAAVLGVPLRAALLVAGGRALGLEGGGWGRVPALLGVELVTAGCAWLAAVAAGLPLLGLGIALVARGWFALGTLSLFAGAVLGTLLHAAIRGVLGFAPAEAVFGRRGGAASLRRAVSEGRGSRLLLAALWLAGDTLVLAGGLLCGAGALPGYPIADLAVLHRWSAARAVTPE